MSNDDNARNQAKAQYENIVELVERLDIAQDDEDYRDAAKSLAENEGFRVTRCGWDDLYRCHKSDAEPDKDDEGFDDEDDAWFACCEDNDLRPSVDDAQQAIQEDPLSVEVRSGWVMVGDPLEPEEFMILLCTGGPACRIRGDLNQYHEPTHAFIEYQDWGTPWTEYVGPSQDVLLTYARQFYFGVS